jgi:hypothetical protein
MDMVLLAFSELADFFFNDKWFNNIGRVAQHRPHCRCVGHYNVMDTDPGKQLFFINRDRKNLNDLLSSCQLPLPWPLLSLLLSTRLSAPPKCLPAACDSGPA